MIVIIVIVTIPITVKTTIDVYDTDDAVYGICCVYDIYIYIYICINDINRIHHIDSYNR